MVSVRDPNQTLEKYRSGSFLQARSKNGFEEASRLYCRGSVKDLFYLTDLDPDLQIQREFFPRIFRKIYFGVPKLLGD